MVNTSHQRYYLFGALAVVLVAAIVLAIVFGIRASRREANTIRVTALDEDSQKMPNATVVAQRVATQALQAAKATREAVKVEAATVAGAAVSGGSIQASGTTDANGRWQAGPLANGSWEVRIGKENFATTVLRTAVSGEARADANVTVEGWSITQAYVPLRDAVENLAKGD